MDNALVALTDKYKNRLNTHVKELYVKHTTEWNEARQERLDEDTAINWTRTNDLRNQYEAHMATMREQNDRNTHTITAIPGEVQRLTEIVTEQRTLVEKLQESVAAQITEQETRQDANLGAMAFVFDDYTEQMNNTTTSVVDRAREQLTNWLEDENETLETKVRAMVKDQIDAHIENCQGVIQADLDSMQPTATELMQESLQTFKREMEKIWNMTTSNRKSTPIVETIDETTGEPVQPPSQQELHWQRKQQGSTRWKVPTHIREALETGQTVHQGGIPPKAPPPQNPYLRQPRMDQYSAPPDQYAGYTAQGGFRTDDSAYMKEKKLSDFRKAALPTMIMAQDAQGTKKEYCAFHYFCEMGGVPLVPWDDIHAEISTLYPTTANAPEYSAFSKLIYQKLEEDASMDTTGNPLLKGLMNQHSGARDGYAVLKEITRRFANKENKADSANRNLQPKFTDDIFEYAGELATYYEYQAKQNRHWEPIEKTTLFLEATRHDAEYGQYAQDVLTILRLRPTGTPMEVEYELASLPTTLLRTKDQRETDSSHQYSINRMTTRDGRRNEEHQRGEGRYSDGRHSDDQRSDTCVSQGR